MGTQQSNEVLSSREFDQITELAYRTCGINLKNGKEELVQARLGKKIRERNFDSFKAYYDHVVADPSGEELIALLDALTTNFTSFLRESAHFDLLRKTIAPGISGQIRVWSAACSTGEEPFTIALSLLEELGAASASRIQILATDISTRALATAERAVYAAERFRDFPHDWPRKYLLRGSGQSQGRFLIKPEIRRLIEFRRFNLMDSFQPRKPFHVIFCRNVMIYFNKETQEQLVNRFASCLEPGGYLLIGHSESLTGLKHPYQYIKPAVYRKAGMNVTVGVADCHVTGDASAVLVTYALGSCVGISIYDPVAHVGGLLHFMLPQSPADGALNGKSPYMFADRGIPMLFHEAYEKGAQKRRLRVRVAGGAQIMDDKGVFNIGQRNCLAMRKIFWKAGVIVESEETGGTTARTMRLEMDSGRVYLRSPNGAAEEL